MRSIVSAGPTADQDGVAVLTVVDDVSITVTDRVGTVCLICAVGYTDTDVLASTTTCRILRGGVPIASATSSRTTGAVDNLAASVLMFAVVEDVAVGETFTIDIDPSGSGVDVKADNCKLMAIGLSADAALVPNFGSP